jgi:hypothetical protein
VVFKERENTDVLALMGNVSAALEQVDERVKDLQICGGLKMAGDVDGPVLGRARDQRRKAKSQGASRPDLGNYFSVLWRIYECAQYQVTQEL